MIYLQDRTTKLIYVAYEYDFLKFIEALRPILPNKRPKETDLIKIELPVKVNLASSYVDLNLTINANSLKVYDYLDLKSEETPVDLEEHILWYCKTTDKGRIKNAN